MAESLAMMPAPESALWFWMKTSPSVPSANGEALTVNLRPHASTSKVIELRRSGRRLRVMAPATRSPPADQAGYAAAADRPTK